MTKKTKIKFSASYDSSANLTERVLKQFKTENINLSNYEFVYDDTYDVIVFFNNINLKVAPDKKILVFPHEPSWNGVHQKIYDKSTIVFGFDQSLYNIPIIESIAHTFYGGRGPWIDSLDFWSYDNLKNFQCIKSKNIFSSITSLSQYNSLTCLYSQRFKIYEIIKNIEFIDTFEKLNRFDRMSTIVDYKFNLAIENEYQKNWITEKFYDSILTNTIPIYFGCKNIKSIYPEDGYILIEDINNLQTIQDLSLIHI